ncbi:hypothetical protein IMZ48_13230 [Candidatus Bathyarchaeota archaeon]|nr:hypothetical protein [Candidatus Bathyarchaeota archaeon]
MAPSLASRPLTRRSLSNDLYQTPTHFLLELIQNADDNTYDENVTPCLSIVYRKGVMAIACTERGFTKRNVEAICRICQSTKSGRSKSGGFVGEKGIGFKAVFKVASSVSISSGHYSFRFDRDGHLGMIAPVWDESLKKWPGNTMITLKLDKDCDEDRIVEELRSYDERSLLFLRRLRNLTLVAELGGLLGNRSFRTELSRRGESAAAASTMVLKRNGVEKHYFVWRHMAEKLPVETLRPGISSSEIVLAFPYTIDEKGELRPVIESQHAYAFLPVRDAGFPVSTTPSS